MKNNKSKGFTLAELLIVVAIIAVLVAISIPIFTSQLEKARRTVDINNARNIRSVLANAINNGDFVFNKEDAMLEVEITRGRRNGGFTGNAGGVQNDLMINGITYHDTKDGGTHGFDLVWNYLVKNGIPKNLTMKQKNSSVDWYGVCINGKGESFYCEGVGKAGSNRKMYAWSDLNTPVSSEKYFK